MIKIENKGKVKDRIKVRITEDNKSITRLVKPETLRVLREKGRELSLSSAEELIFQLEGEKEVLREIPLSLIDFPEFNVPKKFLESVKEYGILEPPLVTPTGEGRYKVIAGRRRLNAARLLGFDAVKCIVKESGEETVLTLIENFHRADNPALEAELIDRLIKERGLKKSEVALLLNVSNSHITKRLKLLNLIPEIFEKLKKFEINTTVARELAKLSPEEQREYLKKPESKWTIEDVEKFVRTKKIEKSAKLALAQALVPEVPSAAVPVNKLLNPQTVTSVASKNGSPNQQPLSPLENQANESLIKDMEEIAAIAADIKNLAGDNGMIVKKANQLLKIARKYLNQTVEV